MKALRLAYCLGPLFAGAAAAYCETRGLAQPFVGFGLVVIGIFVGIWKERYETRKKRQIV